MATSDSEDFESADEELVDTPSRKRSTHRQWQSPAISTIGSDSDDDNECMPAVNSAANWNSPNRSIQSSGQERRGRGVTTEGPSQTKQSDEAETTSECPSEREKPRRQRKPKAASGLAAKKLGCKTSAAPKPPPVQASSPDEIRRQALAEGKEPPVIEECWEFDEEETAKILRGLNDVDRVKMPEELTSEKKFKEIFKPDGWEGLDDERILSELEDDRIRPVLEKIAGEEAGWASWGSWGVNSLINSAAASVSTLTSHVTHGLTLLDEAMGAPSPEELAVHDVADATDPAEANKTGNNEETRQPQTVSFGLTDIISGVSSITKLVETTGTKVISGGLGTLETIGKKTMQVLQEGDPGLKKKRAFFSNESDRPILSQMLREAKEKAELDEKSLEEKQMMRKVHFESLFDDYQGLVHLEALEMLSKQCNMKIQQRLVTLDTDELDSIQETLDEVKELCDLGDEEEDEEEDADDDGGKKSEDSLNERLTAASKDLGVSITYEKLNDIWKDTRRYVSEISSSESTNDEREVFQRAISTLARFTAFAVERFHKTAELLLIKERRSTVNEADALVQLTRIFSGQIGIAAHLFSNWLNERVKETEKPNSTVNITTIFLEAANASSYIQDAFRLLIPILQVGAI